jgi:hypothetical protein
MSCFPFNVFIKCDPSDDVPGRLLTRQPLRHDLLDITRAWTPEFVQAFPLFARRKVSRNLT